MEALVTGVNWQAVVAGALTAYLVGWVWYSPKLFGIKWALDNGISLDPEQAVGPMWKAMAAQIIATILLAITVGVADKLHQIPLVVLMLFTIMFFLKANALFAQKTTYVIIVDSLYLLLMGAIMIAAHAVM